MPVVGNLEPLVPRKPLIGFQQTCDLIGLHRNTGYILVARNEFPLPVIRQGRRYFVTRAAIMKHLDLEDTLEPTTPTPPTTALSATEQAALERLRGLGPNVTAAAGDVKAVVAAVDRLAG